MAHWFNERVSEEGKFEPVLVDLADFNLPVYDEPLHPIFRQYQHEHTKRWSASVASADAFVFVTPEYNYNPPPPFVNALDYVYDEWNYKPCGFVSYGGASGGVRAVQVEKQLVTTLKMMPMVEGVAIPGIADLLAGGKLFKVADSIAVAAKALLEELLKWTTALRALRERPSVASQSDLTAEHVRTPAAEVRADRTRAASVSPD